LSKGAARPDEEIGLPDSLPPSARFQLVYQALSAISRGDGEELRYIEIDDGHRVHRIYRYRLDDATPATATAMTRPAGPSETVIDFVLPLKRAELTSPFGWRFIRFQGPRFHRGVVFRHQGNAVFGSARASLSKSEAEANYGTIHRIRSRADVETTYRASSGFALGLYAGKRSSRPGYRLRRSTRCERAPFVLRDLSTANM